jgi:glutathione S-transferase
MKIYADPITVNCRKVLAGLDFLGVPYERVHVDYFKSEQKSPEYLAINPNASLPAMEDDGFVLWESNAILQYAADKANNARAYSLDLKKRADINRWMLWESSSWFPACYVYLVEHCVKPLFDQKPDAAVLSAQDATFHKLAGILDQRLSTNRWITGADPTIADIAIAAPMHMHGLQKLPLGPHKNLTRWMTQDVEKLPAWDRTWVGPGFTLTRPAA